MKRIITSKRGQISMEFAVLIGAAVAVAAIAGFYYVKHTQNNVKVVKDSTSKTQSKLANKNTEYIDNVKEVLEKG